MRRHRGFLSFCGLALLGTSSLALGGCAEERPCPSSLTKGPWVQRVDQTRASVRWEAESAGCVELALTPEDGSGPERLAKGRARETQVRSEWGARWGIKQPDVAGTFYVHEVALERLRPGSCYRYRLKASGTAGAAAGGHEGRFCTARPAGEALSFLAVADTNPILGHTVPVIERVLPRRPDFVLHAGDIQYYSSLGETWVVWFQRMAPLLRAGAFFPAIGNHEDEKELGGLEYADYYGRLFVPASVEELPRWYRFESGGVWFFSLDTESPLTEGSPQLTWLEGALADAAARPGFRFSVPFFHRPIYTLGDTDPLFEARGTLEPLFEANGVRLVIQGHMHGYERFELPSGITYLTCAGGGGVVGDPDANVDKYPEEAPLRVRSSPLLHSCLVSIRPDALAVEVVGESGAVIDQFEHALP